MATNWSFESNIQWDYSALDKMENQETGDVGQYMKKRGQLIVLAAKKQVGVKTGALKLSIKMIHGRDTLGQFLWIGSEDRIAFEHHEGTRPHIITPKRHQAMRFTSGGRVIYTRLVKHPGTKPNRYLADNLYLIKV
jgi:hypothetical protein